MSQKPKLRITQSLLSAWLWLYKLDNGYEDFLNVLNRVKTPPTEAMLNGQRFEGLINACLDGQAIPEGHEWTEQVQCCVNILQGAQKQVTVFKDISIDGQDFLLHGVLDFLKEGKIYDTKFSKSYNAYNKYLTSPQTPMYFALVPEARSFEYLICDGKYVYSERYTPDEVLPIEYTIKCFMRFLSDQRLTSIYIDKWGMK